jgi:ABC-type phosphate transport system substrate-binding protein
MTAKANAPAGDPRNDGSGSVLVRIGRAGRARRLVAAAVLAVGALCGVLLPAAPGASATSYVPISGAGSTWSANAFADWTSGVQQYGMRVDYLGGGSTVGRNDFKTGTVTFGASDIPYGLTQGTTTDPPPQRGYAYMPDTAGGTVFMYNLKIGNTQVTNLRLSGQVVTAIFTGRITNWDDPAIQADNPGLQMPNLPIVPVVRSDGAGSSYLLTQWMLATDPSDYNAYCNNPNIAFHPCTPTSNYPVLPPNISRMIAQNGDLGVAGYVSQQQNDGAIGYVQYSYAINAGFPVVLLLNQAGYYTAPTAGNVAVSLLQAKIVGCSLTACSNPNNNPLYLTQNLSQVYSDADPRTYELSGYSYMIIPTDLSMSSFTTAQGYTLGAFGGYMLCQGQVPLDQLGYSSLPINLVEAGFQQLQKIPGNQVPATTTAQIAGCHNPTFSTNGTNTLAVTDPYPAACDKQGPTQCTAGTGGAQTSTPAGLGGAGAQSQAGSNGTSSGHAASKSAPQNCNPDQGNCSQAGTFGSSNTGQAVSVTTPPSLGDNARLALMSSAGFLLLCLIVLPPVIVQAGRRRQERRSSAPFSTPGALR